MDKNKHSVILKNVQTWISQRSIHLLAWFIGVTVMLIFSGFLRTYNTHNRITNKKTSVHAFKWSTAIHNGGTNDYGYNISREQLFAIQKTIGKDMKISEFRSILPFKVDSYLLPSDGRGNEFTIRIQNQHIEDSIYYYDFTLAYVLYSFYENKTVHSNKYYFSARVKDNNVE